eukprot:14716-Heterococcus_DN1.PRE.1
MTVLTKIAALRPDKPCYLRVQASTENTLQQLCIACVLAVTTTVVSIAVSVSSNEASANKMITKLLSQTAHTV